MAYLVNGVEYTTKKDATAALYDEVEKGEVTFSQVQDPAEGDFENEGGSAAPGGVGGGVPVEL